VRACVGRACGHCELTVCHSEPARNLAWRHFALQRVTDGEIPRKLGMTAPSPPTPRTPRTPRTPIGTAHAELVEAGAVNDHARRTRIARNDRMPPHARTARRCGTPRRRLLPPTPPYPAYADRHPLMLSCRSKSGSATRAGMTRKLAMHRMPRARTHGTTLRTPLGRLRSVRRQAPAHAELVEAGAVTTRAGV